MKCAWDKLLMILPPRIRTTVDRIGRMDLQELRLRLGRPTELVLKNDSKWLEEACSEEDIHFVVNTSSKYSPWAAQTIAQGYITAPGGHRVGLCGYVVVKNGDVVGIRQPESLCVRVARDYLGIAARGKHMEGNILILGPPGSGKTTLLRDWIRQISNSSAGSVAVIDERNELFPHGLFDPGKRTDIQSGCDKPRGIEMVLKTMGPETIAVDEITSDKDCVALTEAGWCGVRLVATAHAATVADLRGKTVYKKLLDTGLFTNAVVLRKDKTWNLERLL